MISDRRRRAVSLLGRASATKKRRNLSQSVPWPSFPFMIFLAYRDAFYG
jgi:hypothetical protein